MFVGKRSTCVVSCNQRLSVSNVQMGRVCELEIVVNIDYPAFIMSDSSHLLGFY